MEIFDRMKSMVGIGKPTLAIGSVLGPARAGEPLRGTVVLRGGDYDAAVKDVTVRLDEERIVYPTPGRPERQFWRRVATQEIAMNGRVLKKDEVLELAFELLLPVEAFAWIRDGLVVSVIGVHGTKHYPERGNVAVFTVKKISEVVR